MFGKWLLPKTEDEAEPVREAISPSIEAALRKATSDASKRLDDAEIITNRFSGFYVFRIEGVERLSLDDNLVDSGYYGALEIANAIVSAAANVGS